MSAPPDARGGHTFTQVTAQRNPDLPDGNHSKLGVRREGGGVVDGQVGWAAGLH